MMYYLLCQDAARRHTQLKLVTIKHSPNNLYSNNKYQNSKRIELDIYM